MADDSIGTDRIPFQVSVSGYDDTEPQNIVEERQAMQHWKITTVVLAAMVCSGQLSRAEKGGNLKPVLVKPGKVVLAETFSRGKLGKQWVVNKGDWAIADGVVVGREKAEDHHAAVLTCKVPNRDSAIQLSFKLADAKFFHLSFNRSRGHLFRVIITPKTIVLRTDKPTRKSTTKPVTLAEAKTTFHPDRWYTLLVEVRGDRVVVTTDNGVLLKGSHSALDIDKPNYRFVMRGKSFQLDDVKIWKSGR